MLIPLGEMREIVVVRLPVTTVDASGGEVQGYSESDPIYVSIRSLNSREFASYGQVNGEISHMCFGHYNDLNAIGSDCRIRNVETDQEFDISGPPVNSPKRDWSKLTLIYRENG